MKGLTEIRPDALEAGMNRHIAKPIDVEKLIRALSEILKRNNFP